MSQLSLELFAQKVEQEKQARKIYLSKLKSPSIQEKKNALTELKKVEEEVDALLYGILHPKPVRQFYNAYYKQQQS